MRHSMNLLDSSMTIWSISSHDILSPSQNNAELDIEIPESPFDVLFHIIRYPSESITAYVWENQIECKYLQRN